MAVSLGIHTGDHWLDDQGRLCAGLRLDDPEHGVDQHVAELDRSFGRKGRAVAVGDIDDFPSTVEEYFAELEHYFSFTSVQPFSRRDVRIASSRSWA